MSELQKTQLLNWSEASLSAFASPEPTSFVDGPFGSDLKVSDYAESGVRILQLQNLGDGYFIDDNVKYASERKALSLSRCLVRPGDLLIAKMADPLARACIVPPHLEKGLIVADLIKLRLDREHDATFICSAINGTEFRREAERLATGTTRTRISLSTLKRIRLRAPKPKEQRRIGDLIRTVDEAIEQTEALIAKYQQIKAGLMHDLFTRGITPDGHLRPTQAQVPHLYKESPLGWIPKEWEVVRLDSIAEVDRGKFTVRPRNDPRFYGGPYPFIQTGDVALAGGRTLNSYSQSLNELGLSVSRLFPSGAIMVTIAANIADTCILGIPMCAPDSLVGVQPKTREDAKFIELSIRRRKVWLEACAPQTAQRNINLEDLRPLLISWPDSLERLRISERYEVNDAAIVSCETQVHKLRQQKQGLMQDLLTGRVRVKVPEVAKTSAH